MKQLKRRANPLLRCRHEGVPIRVPYTFTFLGGVVVGRDLVSAAHDYYRYNRVEYEFVCPKCFCPIGPTRLKGVSKRKIGFHGD